MRKQIFYGTYHAEDIQDAPGDIEEAILDLDVETNEDGFFKGSVTITVTYEEPEA